MNLSYFNLWIVVVLVGAYVHLSSSAVEFKSDVVFETIKKIVSGTQDAAKALGANYLFKITINNEVIKEWTLDLKNANVYEGAPKTHINATVTISDRDILTLVYEKGDPIVAYQAGRVKVDGDPSVVGILVRYLQIAYQKTMPIK